MKNKLRVIGPQLVPCLFLLCLLLAGKAEHAQAGSDLPYQFQAGTTIRAQEINQNFSYLNSAMPGMQSSMFEGSLTLDPIVLDPGGNLGNNILALTVKPHFDGQILLFANGVVHIELQQGDDQNEGGMSGVATFCLSSAPRGLQGYCTDVMFQASNTGDARSLKVPVSFSSPMYPGVSAGLNVSYYLSGYGSVYPPGQGSVIVTRARLTALFVPGYLEQITP